MGFNIFSLLTIVFRIQLACDMPTYNANFDELHEYYYNLSFIKNTLIFMNLGEGFIKSSISSL